MGTHQLPTINNSDIFEDSICDLFNHIESTITYKRFGKNGHNQKGIDIFSTEKDCAIQCKKKDLSRKDLPLKNELLEDIKKDVNKVINDKLKIKINKLIFVSTYKDHPDIDEYCEVLKENLETEFEIIYWGWDTLEGKFLDNNKLLQKYWSNFILHTGKETNFERNLNLRKEISKDFGDWLNYKLENRTRSNDILIRAYDGKQYPHSNKPNTYGKYEWFKVEILRLYHSGIEFIYSVKQIQIFENYSWDFTNENSTNNKEKMNVYEIVQINFKDIVGYNMKGDEFYIYPHIFCKFLHKGTPFEKIYYQNVSKTHLTFELEKRRK
ncbi:hypothetical protein D9V96_003665 [Zobellia laminariae]|uniref:hypothetical protein n=1 Tax=Zobellia laminariae TaxID=248906 RepID=UPI0012D8D64D|nr:hypothetical protein [Zobellia laminariae]